MIKIIGIYNNSNRVSLCTLKLINALNHVVAILAKNKLH